MRCFLRVTPLVLLVLMQYRAKPYPWVCSDCSLFDKPCFAKCKEQSG
jgi:hypothetical protein